jgi:hypothetical protein
MSYTPLPLNTNLSQQQFIEQMNLALRSLNSYKSGMEICFDSNGYWLEFNGVKDTENVDLLSAARLLVLRY